MMNDFLIKKYCSNCEFGDGYNCHSCDLYVNKYCFRFSPKKSGKMKIKSERV